MCATASVFKLCEATKSKTSRKASHVFIMRLKVWLLSIADGMFFVRHCVFDNMVGDWAGSW